MQQNNNKVLNVFSDGSFYPQMNRSSVAVVTYDSKKCMQSAFTKIVDADSCSFAELYGVHEGIKAAVRQKADEINLFCDNEPLVSQLNKAKLSGFSYPSDSAEKKLLERVRNEISHLKKTKMVSVTWIPRNENSVADAMCRYGYEYGSVDVSVNDEVTEVTKEKGEE